MKVSCLIIIATSIFLTNTTNADQIYEYKDEEGNVYFTDNIDLVPKSHREKNKQKTNVVVINKKQIMVPVVIKYKNTTAKFDMIIDTGCSGVAISPAIAQKLGISKDEGRQSLTQIADGSKISTRTVIADKVTVGPKTSENVELTVTPNKDDKEFGLLGMGFLKDHPHMINIKGRTINWM
jgi:clan AA aspartic protease (TIGR02281 family)